MWLACYTQEEIAEEVGVSQKTIDRKIADFSQNGNIAKMTKIPDSKHETDFAIPLSGKEERENERTIDFQQ